MKRSDALAPLSRDHQHALRTALRLCRAKPDSVLARPVPNDQLVAAATALGERLNAHVRYEERVLFAILEQRFTATQLRLLHEGLLPFSAAQTVSVYLIRGGDGSGPSGQRSAWCGSRDAIPDV